MASVIVCINPAAQILCGIHYGRRALNDWTRLLQSCTAADHICFPFLYIRALDSLIVNTSTKRIDWESMCCQRQ